MLLPYFLTMIAILILAYVVLSRMTTKIKAHCCRDMCNALAESCEQHPDRFDCPDCLIHHSKSKGEYGIIIHDGGGSYRSIRHCPWCGEKL